MNLSFGIAFQSPSRVWRDVRKGPPLRAVREHLDRVANYRRFAAMAENGETSPLP